MRIIICRHGETEANLEKKLLGLTDKPLNERGQQQADILGRYLSRFSFSSIYSSSLRRAEQTAEAIARYQKCKNIIQIPGFNERYFGDFEMKTWKGVFEEIPDLRTRWKEEGEHFRFPGGEVLSEFVDKVQEVFKETISEHNFGEEIAIVAHSGSIKAMIGYMFGTSKAYIPHLCLQGNCAVNQFFYDGNKFKVDLINYTSYHWDVNGI